MNMNQRLQMAKGSFSGKDWVVDRGTLEGYIEDKRAADIIAAKEKADRRLEQGSRSTKFIDDAPPR